LAARLAPLSFATALVYVSLSSHALRAEPLVTLSRLALLLALADCPPRVAVAFQPSSPACFANAAPVTGLQAAPGDRGVLRIAFVGTDASGTLVRVEPRDEGSTSLVIVASGQRRDLSVTVAKQPPPGIALCP